MSWNFHLQSSPPSTPGKSRDPFNDLSSTPAGAPPSASNSFAPHGGPSDFGSSRMSSGSLFTKSGHMNLNDNDSIFGSSIMSNDFLPPLPKKTTTTATKSSAASQSLFSITNGSRFDESTRFGQSNGFTESQMDAEGDDILTETEDEVVDKTGSSLGVGKADKNAVGRFSFLDSQLGDSIAPQPVSLGHRKSIYSNPGSAKRPKLDERWAGQAPLRKGKLSPKKDSAMPSIVRNLARSRLTTVDESSDFVMSTEDELCRMYDEVRKADYNGTDLRAALSDVCSRLANVWKTATGQNGPYQESDGIGPGDQASNIAKASFLASLHLQLHHPPRPFDRPGQVNPFATRNLLLGGPRTTSPTPIPRLLIDWLDANHIPPASELQVLKAFEPNPTASSSFWDLLNAAVLRGSLSTAVELLRSADFNYARSALEDGLPQAGYRGTQLQNIQRCVNKALQILESCPGVSRDDWDVKGAEWALFRRRVLAAVTDLEEFAEGEDKASPEPPVQENRFQAVNFGLKATAPAQTISFTQSARMAESKVPWAIYQNLRSMYRILLGDEDAIMENSQDWLEATICMTVWWGGDDDDEVPSDLPPTSLNPLFSRPARNTSPTSVQDAYLRRLDLAFGHATSAEGDDASFRVNSLSSLEVGLASVFEGNVEGVIELLQTWSLCVSCAVVEVASIGGWLNPRASKSKSMPGLSEDDLMVLSYGQGQGTEATGPRVNKNDVISAYASGLFERQSIECQDGTRNGWEVALEVLSRLDDRGKLQKSVSELLDRLPLNTAEEVDKVVMLCSELDLDNEGRKVSERFGDSTVADSEDYGLALLCYARAHNRRKVKSVVDLLISYSLVQSRAYPASNDLDEQLESLIRDPGRCLAAIAGSDEDAASILQYYFSGYATLRRYYEIRDEAENLKEGQQPRYKPLARRRAAAQALVAVIGSAADSIYGGLYDPDRDSAVQVDGLLTLLGEVLPFVDQPTPILSVSQQFTILSAIEDLQTVTPRVYAQCEECFRSTLIEYQSSKNANTSSSTDSYILPPSPRAMLKKSVSAPNASSTFSIIGSEMVGSARTLSGSGSAGSSGVLVPRLNAENGPASHERGWDWRAGLSEDVTGEDIMRILRLGLARGVSFSGLGSI
ncbi:hypothetical protein BO86DRAFT_387476 [Aspergillus japonicus CBS 114.51]|uniref:Nuclear pore complex protein Nup85 n=2 Tax=Aspergillus TaxID=5052 RepID=A0A2V5HXX3_ASPV1|nr:hypothetical protein BO86DRAFT_387476 [Aspergillus japonicus CBS 114.51]PYI16717.1 hypothetical protein BO99DRAFT_365562 [Aspergillus violaceofuscus CBS 115571]RAH84024.1 hypothetical protein BO86DRAFT_387476 [Aspergillus japonicus CBS 114.51]